MSQPGIAKAYDNGVPEQVQKATAIETEIIVKEDEELAKATASELKVPDPEPKAITKLLEKSEAHEAAH